MRAGTPILDVRTRDQVQVHRAEVRRIQRNRCCRRAADRQGRCRRDFRQLGIRQVQCAGAATETNAHRAAVGDRNAPRARINLRCVRGVVRADGNAVCRDRNIAATSDQS